MKISLTLPRGISKKREQSSTSFEVNVEPIYQITSRSMNQLSLIKK